MDRTCKHTFRPGCEDLEGRKLLSSVTATPIKPPPVPKDPLLHPVPPGSPIHFSPTLQADFVAQPSGVPGFLYEAAIVSVQPNSQLNFVALLPSGLPTSLNPGDRILSLDNLPVNVNGSNLEDHTGLTTIQFARAGSNVVQNGEMILS